MQAPRADDVGQECLAGGVNGREGEWSPRIIRQVGGPAKRVLVVGVIVDETQDYIPFVIFMDPRASDLIKNRGETRLMQQSTVRRLKSQRNKGEKASRNWAPSDPGLKEGNRNNQIRRIAREVVKVTSEEREGGRRKKLVEKGGWRKEERDEVDMAR